MNESQHQLYMYHWGRARRALRATGKSPKECDAERKRAHFVIGACFFNYGKLTIKSSKVLNNKDLDLFIAYCQSIADARDPAAQLAHLEMPRTRALYATGQLLDALGLPKDEDHRAAYLEGILKKPLADSDESDLQRLVIACNHNRLHKSGIDHNHPRVGKGRERHDHRVGTRPKPQPQPTQMTISDYGQPF